MIKGILVQASLAQQILSVLALALIGSIVFSSLGILLASGLYELSSAEVIDILGDAKSHREVFKLVQGLATLGTFLFPAVVGAHLISPHPEELLGLKSFLKPAWLVIILLLLASYGMGAVSDLLYRLSLAIPTPDFFASWRDGLEEKQAFMLEQYQSILNMGTGLDFLQVLVVMAVIPAIAEESLFRGLLQPLLGRHVNKHAAIWITALIFGLLHSQYLAFLSISILGALLGYLREWTNSLWLPTILHFFNNASIVVMVYYFDYDYTAALEGSENISYLESGLLIGLLALSMAIIYELSQGRFRKSESK